MKVVINNHLMREYCLKFQEKNKLHGISGILLFSSGVVMQYIEGEQDQIDNLYSNILLDERHHNIIKLLDEFIENKIFKEWSMKFKNVDNEIIVNIKNYITAYEKSILEILKLFVKINNF